MSSDAFVAFVGVASQRNTRFCFVWFVQYAAVIADHTKVPPKTTLACSYPIDGKPDLLAWEAARATSAAPLYFGPFLKGTTFWSVAMERYNVLFLLYLPLSLLKHVARSIDQLDSYSPARLCAPPNFASFGVLVQESECTWMVV